MTEITLRDYQQAAIDDVRESFIRHQNTVLVLATGAGKTIVYAYIAKQTSLKSKSVMIVAHRAELISQGSMSLAQMGVPHQIIGPPSLTRKCKTLHLQLLGKSFIDPFSLVSVGSVQTIVKRLDKLKTPSLLVIDEAQHSPAGMWHDVKEYFNTKTLGLTATPCRSDGVGLGSEFSDMVVGKDMRALIEDGNLSRYIVYSTPEEINFDEVKRIKSGESKGDFNNRDLEKQMDKPKIVGRAVEHYQKYSPGKSCLVFAVSIQHAEHIAEEFSAAGYNFLAISGKTDDLERFKSVEDLKAGKIDGIVNCDLFGEGVSIDGVEVVIMMRPISELAFGLFSQQVGRALRTFPGKEYAIILDMVGNFQRHGFPEDKTDWTLDDREKAKRGSADNVTKVRACPQCFFTHPPMKHCPACGFIYPIESVREYEQVDGDLVQLQREEEQRQQNILFNDMVKNAQTATELAAADAAMGYKPGAAAHRAKAKEEKKKAISTLSKALRYWKETCLWGDYQKHEELFAAMFGYTESEARKLSTAKMNKLIDKMREFVQAMPKRNPAEYSPYEFDFMALKNELWQTDSGDK